MISMDTIKNVWPNPKYYLDFGHSYVIFQVKKQCKTTSFKSKMVL